MSTPNRAYIEVAYSRDFGFTCQVMDCDYTGPSAEHLQWCKHIENALKTHGDEHVFWSVVGRTNQHNWWPVAVPIIPTQGLWASCKVARANSNMPWALFIVPRDEDSGRESIRLGTVGEGEGRMAWRMLIWDYFQAHVTTEYTKCPGKGHNFAAQGMLTANLKNSGSVESRAQMFSIWYNQKCLGCLNKAASFNPEEDLIPQLKGNNQTNWGNLRGRSR